jgi:hypothetical protein
MKKLLLIVIVFLCTALEANAQGNYGVTFRIEEIGGAGSTRWSGNCGSSLRGKLFLNNSTLQDFFYQPVGDGQDLPRDWYIEFSNTNTLPQLFFYSEAKKWHGGFTRKCKADYKSDKYLPVTYGVTEYYMNADFTPTYRLRATLKILPKLHINPNAELTLPTADKINITSTTGFLPSEYHWQYSLNLTDWIDLNQYDTQSALNIDAADLLGAAADGLHGTNIYIRQIAYNAQAASNIVEYKIRKSAPHILSAIPSLTSCFDSNDGKVKIKFDRSRLDGELLYCSLFNNITQTIEQLPNNADLILDADNSYEITGLAPGSYTFQVGPGSYGITNTFTTGLFHNTTFTIDKPAPVGFTLSKTNVWCNGGNDGTITINATGGSVLPANSNGIRYLYSINNGAWLPFSTETSHILTTLLPGSYTIRVKDYKDCIAKTPQGAQKELTEVITEPPLPVAVSYTEVKQPTFYGGTNGRLVVAVTGGSRNPDNSYNFEWKNSNGVVLTNTSTFYDIGSATFYITLEGIPSDTYTLTITDRNFSSATHQAGCAVMNSEQFLGQPDPLAVTFTIQETISCHVSNAYGDETDFNPADGQRDESQDGILVAHVTGGVPFTGFENNGLPYKYFWKKQQLDGSWTPWSDLDETAESLSHGNYALNIEDKNGIRLGTYVNNLLTQETDMTIFMSQPAKLELSFQKGDIICSAGNNGWAKATATGGTPPYTFEWATGDTSDTISNLIANNYFVKITDAKGCIVQGSIMIDQPNGVTIAETVAGPSCFGGNDGTVQIQVSGGSQPYQYSWNTGATGPALSNLTQGIYTATVTDAQGCTYYKSVTLTDPIQLIADLGPDRTLCNGQSHDLDITIPDPGAQYEWTSTNGFTSNAAAVSLVNPGTYHAKITSLLGCIAQDDIIISTNQVNIASEFFLSTQAYLDEEVILVNASNPMGQNTTWIIPNNVVMVSQNDNFTVLKFNAVGAYTISLKQTQGDCYALYSKVINVEPRSVMPNIGNTSNPFILEFTITPNPNNGAFNAIVKIQENSPIKLRLYALNGQQPLVEESGNGQDDYTIPFNTGLPAGVYALVLETAKQTMVKKIIIF